MVFVQTGAEGVSAALEYVSRYVPPSVPDARWRAIGAAVRHAVVNSAPGLATAKRLCPAITGYAVWLLGEGQNATQLTLCDSELIERYVLVGMPDAAESTRATRRSLLRLMARRLREAEGSAQPEPPRFAYRRVRTPYSASEVRRYLRLAANQPTAGRRASLEAVLHLGLGCGLDGRDMAWVRGSDVEIRPGDAVEVRVSGGSRPRSVTALDRYAGPIAARAAEAGEDLLIGGHQRGRHNVTSVALNRAVLDKTLPRLVASRLRSTWLVEHLQLRTPWPVLLPAAGLQTTRPLDDLLPHLEPVDPHQSATLLRGPAA
jgi:hypothetical protein